MLRALVLSLLLHAAVALRLAVTGAAGYLGSEICWQAVQAGHEVRAVVRSAGTASAFLNMMCEVFEADDLADAVQAREAADGVDVVIHTASVFRSCADMETELVQPNMALAEQMVCACAAANAKLVLTSSMAAVRAGGQPLRGGRSCYTSEDWNFLSQRDGPGFAPYQYSKMASEQRAWHLAKEVGLEMTTLCPSMILGPPRTATSSAFSVQMVQGWLDGSSPVKSLLVCDVRDVAMAHVAAAESAEAGGKRYIVSRESRVPASALADAIRQRVGPETVPQLHAQDEGSQSGALIAVGAREVDATAAAADLGVTCRPDAETVADMAALLLQERETSLLRDGLDW